MLKDFQLVLFTLFISVSLFSCKGQREVTFKTPEKCDKVLTQVKLEGFQKLIHDKLELLYPKEWSIEYAKDALWNDKGDFPKFSINGSGVSSVEFTSLPPILSSHKLLYNQIDLLALSDDSSHIELFDRYGEYEGVGATITCVDIENYKCRIFVGTFNYRRFMVLELNMNEPNTPEYTEAEDGFALIGKSFRLHEGKN